MKNADKPAGPSSARTHSDMTGVTKREYFAGLAMQGLLAGQYGYGFNYNAEQISVKSKQIADELLKELGENPQE